VQAQTEQVAKLRESLELDKVLAEERVQALEKERHEAREVIRDLNERVVTAEGESRQLKSILEHEKSNTEDALLAARQNG